MKIIPILFSTQMVQAILEGRKTQTRRIVKFGKEKISTSSKPISTHECGSVYHFFGYGEKICPYGQPGDILWVRETWNKQDIPSVPFVYKEDYTPYMLKRLNVKWKPSIHMPKEACRLFLKVKSVRVERLQDISQSDAVAEGIKRVGVLPNVLRYKNYFVSGDSQLPPKESFQSLWQSINGEQSWNDNPLVWVVEFEKSAKPDNF